MTGKTIGFVFVDKFADWEYGLLAASAAEWFGSRTLALTLDGNAVKGISGLELMPNRSANANENNDLDAVAVIGSDTWAEAAPPDVSQLLQAVAGRGGVVGGICAGTLALARAGLFDGRRHTGNGRDWIDFNLPVYRGAEHYIDVPHAVADGNIVSAPGSAPGTFARAFLGALYPGRETQLAEMGSLFAKEYSASS